MSLPARRLEGKVAIITGGASGFNGAAARLFVQNGMLVLIIDIQDEQGVCLAQELSGAEGMVAAYRHCDVTMEEEVEVAVRKWGMLDVMFSNIGVVASCGIGLTMEDLDMVSFDRTMAMNVRGSALAVKHAAKAMVKGGIKNRSIICTSSICSITGGQASVDSTITKHAVVGLMRSAASDLGLHGIRVNSISPFIALTPLSVNYIRQLTRHPHMPLPDIQSLVDSFNVLQHHSLTPLDNAYAALYLASDESAFISGLNLVVDGTITSTTRSDSVTQLLQQSKFVPHLPVHSPYVPLYIDIFVVDITPI